MPVKTEQKSEDKIKNKKDKLEYVPVKVKEDGEVTVELEKDNIDKLYAKLLKAGVNENVLRNLDGGMLANSDLTSVEKILDKKAKENKMGDGTNKMSTMDLGTFS